MVDQYGVNFDPVLTLYNPDGTREYSDSGAEQAGFDCWTVSFGCDLSQTGTYHLLVDESGVDTGTYEIHYKRLAVSSENGPLVNEGMVKGELTKGDIDSFTFEAITGDSVTIQMTETSGTDFSPVLVLYNPDGTREYLASGVDDATLNCFTNSFACDLKQTGTYHLLVGESGIDEGSYEISFDGPLQSTVLDHDVALDLQSKGLHFYTPNQTIEYLFSVTNFGTTEASNVYFRHDVPSDIGDISSSCESSTEVTCAAISEDDSRLEYNIDLPSNNTALIRVLGKADIGATATIRGGAWIQYEPDPIKGNNFVNFTFYNSLTPPDAGPINDLWISEPVSLIRRNNEAIDPDWPTVLLVHGLQDVDVTPDDLWNGFGEPNHAGNLIRDRMTDVNVIQVFWDSAKQCLKLFSLIPFPNWSCYKEAKSHIPIVGKVVATKLRDELGPGYTNKIHLIGHSLGSGVIAYAALDLLTNYPSLNELQLTILDQPHNIERIPGFLLFDANAHRFELDFMSTVLADIDSTRYQIDNYFAFSDSRRDGAGVGDPICGSNVYNHPELVSPHESANIIGENKPGPLENDHSGVHQWYRLSIAPYTPFPSFSDDAGAVGVCSGSNWNPGNSVVSGADVEDLEPACETGWKLSNLVRSFSLAPNAEPCPGDTKWDVNSFSQQNFEGCSFEFAVDGFLGGNCTPLAALSRTRGVSEPDSIEPQHGKILIDVPGGATHVAFDYLLSNLLAEDHVALLIDGELIWQMAGEFAVQDIWQGSGPIPVTGLGGEHELMVIMYSNPDGSPSFEFANIRFILNSSVFQNGFE